MENKTKQSTEAIRKLLVLLPVEEVLKFRKTVKALHTEQLNLVDSILAEKGYSGPLE